MPLTLIKEDGSGMPDANSYAALADGNAYHDAHLYAAAWVAASNADKEKALVMATRLIDGEFQFNGKKRVDGQALQWPRERCPDPDRLGTLAMLGLHSGFPWVDEDKVPARVVAATCEMARELLIADRTAAPAGEGIELRREADLSETQYDKRDKRPVISAVAQSLLSKYGSLLKAGAVSLQRA
jgi:hypothetical protein